VIGISKTEPVLIYHGERIKLQDLINSIRGEISDFKKDNVTIALYLDRTPYLVAAINACLIEGCTYIPLDPEHPAERINSILDEVEPDVVLTHRHYLEKLPDYLVKIDVNELEPREGERGVCDFCQDMDRIAYIIFTSGSTGKPKGVMVPFRALHNLLSSIEKKPGISGQDRVLAITTVSFDIAVFELIQTYRAGAQITLLDESEAKDPLAIINALIQDDITIMQATPVTWKMLVEAGWKGKSDMVAFSTGEALPYELAEELQGRCKELWNLYGPTETTVWATIDRVSKGQRISIGEPINNTEVYILDESMNRVPDGEEGDLYIGGKGLSAGYFKRPDMTQSVFVPNPFNRGETIYKTGDLVRYGKDGRLECLGRSDFQVKIRGFRIELEEIENVLLMKGEVKGAVVHPQTVRNGMKELVAYIIESESISDKDLVEYLARSLPDYMIPAFFVRLENLPLNTNGKIDRKSLPLPQKNEIFLDDGHFALSQKEKILFIWKKVLEKDDVTTDQNFFEIGGNSILAVQVLRLMKDSCDISIPLGRFFQYPVIDELVQLDEIETEETVILLNNTKEGIPLFCLGGIDIYSDLAASLEGIRPVYGVFIPYEGQLIDHIQRDALDEWEFLTVPGMAAAYVRDIRKVYPRGICHILGISIAGVIAFETARLIHEEARIQGEFFVLDSHLPHARKISLLGHLYFFLKDLKNGKLNKRVKQPEHMSRVDYNYVVAMRDHVNDQATEDYIKTAKPIKRNIHLIKAIDNVYGIGETYRYDLGWGDMTTGSVEIFNISDNHLGILNFPGVKKLADYLEHIMEEHI
jgi:amino acid adenylation domain-containing protein